MADGKPYKIWVGDKWACQGCGSQIVIGFPSVPVAERWHEKFDSLVDDLDPIEVQS